MNKPLEPFGNIENKFCVRLTPAQTGWLAGQASKAGKCSAATLRVRQVKFLETTFLFAIANSSAVAARIQKATQFFEAEGINFFTVFGDERLAECPRFTITLPPAAMKSLIVAVGCGSGRGRQSLALHAITILAQMQHSWFESQINAQAAYASAEALTPAKFWLGKCEAFQPKQALFQFLADLVQRQIDALR